MSIYLMCIALLALLVFVLGFHVSLARSRSGALYGGEPEPDSSLYKALRAHGNTVEYVPVLCLLMFILAQAPQAAWVGWTAIAVTVCRFVFVAGILIPQTMAKPNLMRFLGALGTYLGGTALAVAVLLQALRGLT